MTFRKSLNQQGSILIIFLMSLPFLIIIATYYMQLALTSFQIARFDQLHTSAQLAADAGADYAVEQISLNSAWTGTSGEVQLHSDGKLRTTYIATVTNGTNTKTIAVTGKTYWPSSATTASRSVSIYVDLRPVTAGSYSIVSGEGGLYMQNNSKVVGGDVFVNGEVRLQNNAQIGLSTSPINLSVADYRCPIPADSTYPRVCNSDEGGQPIIITGNAVIYGTVKATNQTNGASMKSPGLIAGSTVAPQSLPTYDRTSQKSAVISTITASAASCSGNNSSVTWAANTKITGNVSVSGSCKVTIMGNVWITGSLTFLNNSQLTVSGTLGSTIPVIMVDGSSGAMFQNNSQINANSSGAGAEIITFWSSATCSPDCSSVTGTDLDSSRGITTISLQNNGNAPKSIFYAYWSQVSLGNGGQIGALIGQTISISNNGTITFGSSVSSGSTSWVVNGYRKN